MIGKLKYTVVAICFVCIAIAAKGQKTIDLYLKNGDVILGKITESTDKQVSIRSKGKTLVFQQDDVLEIRKPYVATNEKSYLLAFNSIISSTQLSTGFERHLKYRLQNLYVGAGTGIEILADFQWPIYATARYFAPTASRVKPFFQVTGGWAVGLTDHSDFNQRNFTNENYTYNVIGGPLFAVEQGFMFSRRRNRGLFVKFGYRYQQSKLVAYEIPLVSNRTYHRVSVGVGMLIFN